MKTKHDKDGGNTDAVENIEEKAAGQTADAEPARKISGSMAQIAHMSTLRPDEVDNVQDEEEDEEYFEEDDGYAEGYDGGDEEYEDGPDGEDGGSAELIEAEEEQPEEPEEKKQEHLEHFGDTISLISTPTTEDMFRFMFRHTYCCFVGILGLCISLSAIVMLIVGYGRGSLFTTLLMAFVALMFTVINPLNIYHRAKKQASRANTTETAIAYTVSDAGIDMMRNGEYVAFKWPRIFKVREGKTGFYVYLAPNQAFILPFRNYPDDVDKMRSILVKNVNDPKKCRVKKEA